MEKDPTVLEAPDLVAFILQTKEIQPRPFLRESDRKVCFEFTEDISSAIEEFYRNVSVPIADYCKNLKHVRSMIFTLKAGGGKMIELTAHPAFKTSKVIKLFIFPVSDDLYKAMNFYNSGGAVSAYEYAQMIKQR